MVTSSENSILARSIRAIRKYFGYDQFSMATICQIPNQEFQMIENEVKLVPLVVCFRIVDKFKISLQEMCSGKISYGNGHQGNFHLPKKYAHFPGSTIRTGIVAISILFNALVIEGYDRNEAIKIINQALLENKIDPDIFVFTDIRISGIFLSDLIELAFQLAPNSVVNAVHKSTSIWVSKEFHDLKLQGLFVKPSKELALSIFSSADTYDLNFQYQIENHDNKSIIIANPTDYYNELGNHNRTDFILGVYYKSIIEKLSNAHTEVNISEGGSWNAILT